MCAVKGMKKELICGYILAGGKNSRMNGEKKLFLKYHGETFCSRILHAFDVLSETYISVENEEPYIHLGLPMIVDEYKEIGPMGGICSGLRSIEAEALLVAACDMPMIEQRVVEKLLETYRKNPGIIVVKSEGRIHPLLGIYPQSVLPLLEKLIEEKRYKMMSLLDLAGYQSVEISQDDKSVRNINTPEEYQMLKKEKKPFVFAISGYKNSGKTTLITKLIPELTKKGYCVATIKHDGHDFESDVPGTDSYRHQRAGAYGTAVFSGSRFMITKETTDVDEKCLMQAFPEADIILLEGLKNSNYPKYFCNYPKEKLIDAKKLADDIEQFMHSNL